jgi:hypothetical protein
MKKEQQMNKPTLIVTILLMLSILSFSTINSIESFSNLNYETILDDNSESDDKEQKSEPTLFISTLNILAITLQHCSALELFKKQIHPLIDRDPHFRPPIFS